MNEIRLNSYQKDAVEHLDGPCWVTSIPGSGKTRVLVERVISLMRKGIAPKNILCITFTNKAANEMRERICSKLKKEKPGFFIGTFHSLCAKLLRKIGPAKGYSSHFTILSERDQIDMILQVSRQLEYDIKAMDAGRIGHALNYYRDQMVDFSWVEEFLKIEPMIEIASEYLKQCQKKSMIDFSGLISETIRLIEEQENIKNKIQETFKYILVDEAQDTNLSQFYLVNLLGQKWKNIMLIADPDQCIYQWRGARYQNIQDFLDMHEDCRVISLSKNYRSTPEIIKVADRLIQRNSNRMKIKFETDNKSGEPVKCYSFGDQIKEAEWVGEMSKKLIRDGGWDPSDIAVLYRVNKMSEPIEQSMINNNIPYEVIGSWNFYDRKESRDCIAMLKLVINPKDTVSFHRVAGLLKGMGNITIGKIENRASQKDISLIHAAMEIQKESNSVAIHNCCKEIYNIYHRKWDFSNPAQCLSVLLAELKYEEYLHKKFRGEASERIDNVSQIINACGELSGRRDGLNQYLQRISLITSSDKEVKDNKVSLMSLHAAKGLEFPIVFIIGTEQEIIPHKRAILDDSSGIEEERRLLYVGMTRAKKILYITFCRNRKYFNSFGTMKYHKSGPSEFLKECGLIRDE